MKIVNAKIDLLDSLQDDLQRNLLSELRTENNTFNKIEGGIVQRFESVAGTSTRNYYAEGAARYVDILWFCSSCWQTPICKIQIISTILICALFRFTISVGQLLHS